jgi:hypothetical protein
MAHPAPPPAIDPTDSVVDNVAQVNEVSGDDGDIAVWQLGPLGTQRAQP